MHNNLESDDRETPHDLDPEFDSPIDLVRTPEAQLDIEESVALPPPPVECWRCGKEVDADREACPHCRARLQRNDPGLNTSRSRTPEDESTAMVRVLIVFAGMMVTSLVYGFSVSFGLDEEVTSRQRLQWMLGLEGLDTLLVIAALLWITRPPASPAPAGARRAGAWLGSFLALGVVFGLNLAYHAMLNTYIGVDAEADALITELGTTSLVLLAYCVQPAIIEELFFRHLALGTLRRSTGIHGAVWASSVMFGIAHVGVPLSIPILMAIGLVLGYARVASGSLILPILLHFLHNLFVILLES